MPQNIFGAITDAASAWVNHIFKSHLNKENINRYTSSFLAKFVKV